MDRQETTTDGEIKPEDKSNMVEVDAIQRRMGIFGKYQLWVCFLIFLNKAPVNFHQIAIIFLNPKLNYTCPDTGADSCPCSNPVYNTSLFPNTMAMEFGLICDKKWLASFSQTLFQLGTLIGSIFFGMAADRFGRRLPMLVAVVMQAGMALGAAYAPDYWSFSILRLFVGASVGGTMVMGFVIIMEFCGSQYRDVVSALYQVPFNIGHMLMPLIAYYYRDFRQFQMAISLPNLILLIYFCVLPETPRWLIAVNRTEEATKVIQRVAKCNNLSTDYIKNDVVSYQAAIAKKQVKKGTIVDLFRTPNIRKNILCMAFAWFACSYCFYGVSQYVGQLTGNIFINVAVSGTFALCGSLSAIPLMRMTGRKKILISFNIVCGAVLFVLAVVPPGVYSVACACVGVISSFICFVVVYLYCSELFPTVVRNAAMGFSSMSARIGSMIAPFVIDLESVGGWLPPVVFGIVPILAGLAAFLLPETKGQPFMNTIEEGEAFGKKAPPPKKSWFPCW